MEPLTNKSCYLRLKENLVDDMRLFLIDESGSYTQKEALGIYYGFMNQLQTFINQGTVCLIAPFAKKEIALIIAAVISLGGIVLLGDPKSTRHDFIEQLNNNVKIDVLVSFKNDSWCLKQNNQWFELDISNEQLNASPLLEASKDKPSFYFLTSGSTGQNKIVALSEYSFLNHLARQKSDAGKPDGISYFCLPLHHIFGCGVLLQSLITAHTIFISNTRNYSYALDTIEKYHCTSIANVPTFFYMLIDEQKRNPRDISSLEFGVMAGGAYSKEQFEFVEKSLHITLCSSYGMTEASTVIANSPVFKPFEERMVGVGKPFPDVNVVFKNDDNSINLTEGEICFKGYNLMLGYVENGTLNLPIDEDGYFHTGDIGRVDDNFIIHIVGRKKNIIIRGGENLSPTIIEQKIMSLENIKDACVVGLTDEKYGEVVGAYIVSDTLNKDDLCVLLATKLIKREMPQVIIVSKKMPLLSAGKHNVQLIKKMLKEEKEKNRNHE